MRLVFFGSGEFGLPTLEAIESGPHDLLAAVTQPPRPAGRGGKSRLTPIHEHCEAAGHTVFSPEKPNTPEFEEILRSLAPDLAVVVAYGHLIRRALLAVPRHGFINLHASLLPAYRGAAPVPWAILCGETVSGASVFQLDEHFDTGAVIGTAELPIAGTATSGTYLAELAPLGAALTARCLDAIAAGGARAQPQDETKASRAPKFSKEDGRIRWDRPYAEIDRAVRAFQPWPLAYTSLMTAKGEVRMNVLEIRRAECSRAGPPGTVLAADVRSGLVIMTGDGPARLTTVQPQGKRPMQDRAFLSGTAIEIPA